MKRTGPTFSPSESAKHALVPRSSESSQKPLLADRAVNPRLGAWLYALRHSLTPDQLSILGGPRRRSAWPTQAEIARLAGLTARAYQAVEEGERIPGPRLFRGIASAFQMTDAQQAYMKILMEPGIKPGRALLSAGQIKALVTAVEDPAVVYDHAWNVLAANERFRSELPLAGSKNFLLWHFTAEARRTLVDWERHASDLVARLRLMAARIEDPAAFGKVITRLTRSPLGKQLWLAGVDVAAGCRVSTYSFRAEDGQCPSRTLVELLLSGEQGCSQRAAVFLSYRATG